MYKQYNMVRNSARVRYCAPIFNPWRMCEGYGSLSVCLSVTKLAATYLVCKSKLRYYTVCSPVLASFADGKLLDFSPSSTQRSIYTKGHVPGIRIRSIRYVRRMREV